MVRGVTIIRVLEEGVMRDLSVQVIAGDQVLTMAVHVALCMIGIMEQTGVGALIMVGRGVLDMADTGALNMVDIAGNVFITSIYD